MRHAAVSLLQKARSAVMNYHLLFSSHAPIPSSSSILSYSLNPTAAMSTAGPVVHSSVAEQKRALRSRIRKELRSFPSDQRSLEDMEIQKFVLDSSWFKSAKSLCAYISCEALREVDTTRILSEILKNKTHGVFDDSSGHHTRLRKKLYVPRVEDKNSNMRMLHISTTEDLVANSMNIFEPSPTDASGKHREDVMLASEPVDFFLLPGVAFDRQGRRLGRGGGYYDVFLKNYQKLAKEQKWKQPLLIALAYSPQIIVENVIPVTDTDVPVDALVSPSGVIWISPASLKDISV
ncbi:5-formyltetrahydrofolate cyclo-ligase, mitochondrial isoform X2 [Phalaenopsis equestris]|uniref:5-formyltetrahydrofolate cyclo-ligase, mitochondrial isoform X2 n=1 Tax=Phalaenopsis equestris TaxID=78828 RepID=UPI0009E615BD|nr:5-formyltetrahydrofolate cyclo-ligase, mitochondrial isoform X2 [Phalaenopsis equestris]